MGHLLRLVSTAMIAHPRISALASPSLIHLLCLAPISPQSLRGSIPRHPFFNPFLTLMWPLNAHQAHKLPLDNLDWKL